MWAIAKQILYQGRRFVWTLPFFAFLSFFMENPFWVYLGCLLCCMLLNTAWQAHNIKVYRSLPISHVQVARVLWINSVLGGLVCSLGLFGVYFLGRSYQSVQEYSIQSNITTFALFFLLLLSSISLIMILTPTSLTLKEFQKPTQSPSIIKIETILLIFAFILFYFPLVVLIIDSPARWYLPLALLAGIASLYASWRSTRYIFVNGRFFEDTKVRMSIPSARDKTISYAKTKLFPIISILFKPLVSFTTYWLIYFFGINLAHPNIIEFFESNEKPIILPFVIGVAVICSAFGYATRILPILRLQPLHCVFTALYLVTFPALGILIGITIGIITDYLFPDSLSTKNQIYYILIFFIFYIPSVLGAFLRFGFKVFFILMVLIYTFIFLLFDEWMLYSDINSLAFGMTLGVSLFISFLSLIYVCWFMKMAYKVPKWNFW